MYFFFKDLFFLKWTNFKVFTELVNWFSFMFCFVLFCFFLAMKHVGS